MFQSSDIMAALNMPERSSNMETSKNLSEFRASIIPYDSHGDPNAPILASSGDNINLIFNIPKESFRKLALAAIVHLGSDLDFEHAGTHNSNKNSDSYKQKRSSEISKFKLNNPVNNIKNENTKDIINASEEKGNTPESTINKDAISIYPKLYVNSGNNSLLDVCGESIPNKKIQKPTQNVDRANKFQESPNDSFVVSVNNADISEKILKQKSQAKNYSKIRKLQNFENSLADSINEMKDVSKNISNDKTCAGKSHETHNAKFKNNKLKNVKEKVNTQNALGGLIIDNDAEVTLNKTSDCESSEAYSKSFTKEPLVPFNEYLRDAISETMVIEENLHENSFTSNIHSFIDTTVDANIESASECGDIGSDSVKSISLQSDNSKHNGLQASIRRNSFQNKTEADEVDCAPTRSRRKVIPELSKKTTQENIELKKSRVSNRDTSILYTLSKYSRRIFPIGKSHKSKTLDPTQQPYKGSVYYKKDSTVESEESARITRPKTPDIVRNKDLKVTGKSSPKKYERYSFTAPPSSTSKIQSSKTSVADPKLSANLDFSVSTKQSKQSSKE